MKEEFGELWKLGRETADAVCVTTNGSIVRLKGGVFRGVMGRGVAKQAKDQFPEIERRLGDHIKEHGNHVGILQQANNRMVPIIAFPVKHTWELKADLQLIERSAAELVVLCQQHPKWSRVLLPRPGCGNGGLTWEDVRPLLAELLPDTVVIVEYPRV